MIDPKGLTWRDWASSVILAVNDAWSLGQPPDVTQWQNWAMGLVRASPFTQRTLPDPFGFDNWRDWAERVYPQLEGTD